MTDIPITVTRNVRVGISFPALKWVMGSGNSTNMESHEFAADAWNIRGIREPDDEVAVVIAEQHNDELLKSLVTSYGIVTRAPLHAAKQYYDAVTRNMDKLIHVLKGRSLRKTANSDVVTPSKYLGLMADISDTLYSSKSYVAPNSETIYFIGVPEYLMLGMWAKVTQSEEISTFVATEGGVLEVDLLEQVAPLCDSYRLLQPAGCLACPSNSSCPQSLVGEDMQIEPISPSRVRRFLSKKYLVLPQSDCTERVYGGIRIDYTDISMSGAMDRYNYHKERRAAIALNKAFYKDNCKACALRNICSSSRTLTRHNLGARHYCSGKVDSIPKVTDSNYPNILRILLTSVFRAADASEELVCEALALACEWVESSGHMPGHAAFFYRKLTKNRGTSTAQHQKYPLPRSLLKMHTLLGLQGSFESGNRHWRSTGIGEWIMDSTDLVSEMCPSNVDIGEWVVVFPRYERVAIPHNNLRLPALRECVDTRVLANLYGVSNVAASNVYRFKSARIHLVIEFIALFMTPSTCMWYGPFSSSKAILCSGIPAVYEVPSWYPKDKPLPLIYRGFVKRSSEENLEMALGNLKNIDSVDEQTELRILESNNKLKEI